MNMEEEYYRKRRAELIEAGNWKGVAEIDARRADQYQRNEFIQREVDGHTKRS